MSMRTIATAVGIVVSAAALVIWPGEAGAQLTTQESKDLIKCQEKVAKAGQKFVTTKLKLVEKCGTERMEANLKCAALPPGDPKCTKLLEDAEELCATKLGQIKAASTKFIDDVIEVCAPVETLIFDASDPLSYQALIATIEAALAALLGTPVTITVTTVEELVGALCVGKELLVDLTALLEVPGGFPDPFELFVIEVDDRCTLNVS